jgi:protein-S-isoprenylcysteine O-methyltransferase Ste14
MKRTIFLTYSAIAYVLAIASLAYLIGFLADVGVPKGINDGSNGPLWPSVLIDAALLALFGLHHSITARASFKRWWTLIVPRPIERATYLYMTVALTYLVVYFWQPIPETVWRVQNPIFSLLIYSGYLATWAMMLASTFHFGHFSFFGLSQALERFRNRPEASVPFTARYLYALMRHPISLGWMLTPWLTPHLTVGQLVWALSVTVYVLIATKFEEADLILEIGDDYRRYRDTVPAYIPGTKPKY